MFVTEAALAAASSVAELEAKNKALAADVAVLKSASASLESDKA